jgi:glucose/arabinose dehydrogenase
MATRKLVLIGVALLALLALILVVAGGERATLPVSAGTGPRPALPDPAKALLPTVNIAETIGWNGARPSPAPGLAVAAFAEGLDHPRWLYVLPNGDVLVAETNAPARPAKTGLRARIENFMMKRAGAAGPSANRITLLRDSDGDGVAETRSVFLSGLNSPFGMALVGGDFYVANTDAVLRFPYREGDPRIAAAGTRLTDLPAGPRNHHWTKSLVAGPDGAHLYASVGSNSNVAENGMAEEEGRAAIWEIDRATGARRLFATGLRNPVGLAVEPGSGRLWASVNERDELGSDLVPDYMTSVRRGGFYGWPYSYYGRHVDARVKPGRPDRVAAAHGLARPRFLPGRPARSALRRRRVRRPARFVEPAAGERLQGDLRPVRRRPPLRPSGGRAQRLPRFGRQGARPPGRGRGRQGRSPARRRRCRQHDLAGDGGALTLSAGRSWPITRAMRLIVPLLLLVAPFALQAKPAPPPPARGGPFLSPMGEPFRSDQPAADNVGAWFAAADRDGDRALTLAELRTDAERFFVSLDTDRDGELEMAEIARYENEIAPEVQVGLQMRSTGVGDWRGGRRRRILVYDKGLYGAGRFSFLNIPHPVMAADLDMNRGVSREEFASAADQRFALLDKDRDGRLVRIELPPLPQPRLRRPSGEQDNPFMRPMGNSQL